MLPLFLSLLTACAATNYALPDEPRYAGDAPPHDARGGEGDPDVLTVVTFNIQMAERIDRALDELGAAALPERADVVVLQEMDRDGTERIADALSMSWVYYPGSVHLHGRDFGNAILSRWPIVRDSKIILPHPAPNDGRIRIAVAAELERPGGNIVVYSVHDATVFSPLSHRIAQARAIVDDCARRCGRLGVVIAGDFNTADERGLYATAELFAVSGFSPATPTRLSTADVPIGGSALDHIFVRGFRTLRYGVAPSLGASDHRALWAELRMRRTAPLAADSRPL